MCPPPAQRAARQDTASLRTTQQQPTQRTSSDLRLNPHLHQLALDGVFVELVFHPLPSLSNADVADLLDTICEGIK